MTASDDLSFEIESDSGPLRVVIATSVLRTLAGRSHVTAGEVLDIYRSDLREAAIAKSHRRGDLRTVRLEASDL